MFRAVKVLGMILKWQIQAITHLSKPLECTPPGVNFNVNRTVGDMMGPCRFIICNKCITLVGGTDVGQAVHLWGQGYRGTVLHF